MAQCPSAHFFCKRCITTHASTLLGAHNSAINCIHTADPGCNLPFPPRELARILPAKLVGLWERVKQRAELKEAGLEGWEECPFCEFGCVMEVSVQVDKLLRCRNEEECGVVSCRMCKKIVRFALLERGKDC